MATMSAHGATKEAAMSTSPAIASPPSSNVLGRALRGGSYLFVQKICTFAINSFILRRLHLSVTGAVAVQFELALATVFLFRDSFRLAFLRMPSLLDASAGTASASEATRGRKQQVVNVAWLSTVVSWALGAIIASAMVVRGSTDAASSGSQGLKSYTQVLVMYCAAAMIEALAEPMYLLAHSSVLVGWQVSAQGMGFLVRAFVQYVCIFALQLDGLLSYGLAELAYASTLLLVFCWFFGRKLRENRSSNTSAMQSMTELLPQPVRSGPSRVYFDQELISLLMPLGVQSIVKYLLTEGDKWVLSLFTTLQQMGVYGIVFHLGSLVPRIVFFPLEEATKTVISKMSNNPSETDQAKRFVLILLKLMHLIGLVFVCFGVNYAHTLVMLLYGVEKVESGVGSALAMYCVYIPFLGLNGICEAFVHAVGDKVQLMRLNQLMGVFFVIYAASAMTFMWGFRLETRGIILANCVNMSCRILYCMTFVAEYFVSRVRPTTPAPSTQQPKSTASQVRDLVGFWRQALPDQVVLVAFAVSFVVGAASQRVVLVDESWLRHGIHVLVGGVCFIGVVLSLYVRERKLIREELRQISQGGAKAHKE